MKVMAPVSSFVSAKTQILAGADEIYVGLDDPTFNNITFSGRGRTNYSGNAVNPEFNELADIVQLAHKKAVVVNFAANTQYMSDSPNDIISQKYINYVKNGINAGVDQVIVGDIGNLILLHENKINIPFVASVFLTSFNVETIKFLKKYGVTRVVLPHHMHLSEIKSILRDTDIEVEIFAGVGCSNIDGNCYLMHGCGENINMGIPCKALYQLSDGEEEPVLDATLDCLLCNLDELNNIGVDVIKIIGRDQDTAFTSAMTKIHKSLIDRMKHEKLYAADIKRIVNKIPWWENEFCNKNKCKFRDNKITRSFI